jgi:hypothetical protein
MRIVNIKETYEQRYSETFKQRYTVNSTDKSFPRYIFLLRASIFFPIRDSPVRRNNATSNSAGSPHVIEDAPLCVPLKTFDFNGKSQVNVAR